MPITTNRLQRILTCALDYRQALAATITDLEGQLELATLAGQFHTVQILQTILLTALRNRPQNDDPIISEQMRRPARRLPLPEDEHDRESDPAQEEMSVSEAEQN